MSTRLPFEILAFIVDTVDSDTLSRNNKEHETTTLQTCALVCPALTVHCQKHLFSRIEITLDKPHALFNLYYILVIDHPEIGTYIKVLSVIFCLPQDATFQGPGGILKSYTQVTELSIHSFPSFYESIAALIDSDLPEKVCLELQSILSSPTCKTFKFDGLAMPISTFAIPHRSCTLESLTLVQNGFYQEGDSVLCRRIVVFFPSFPLPTYLKDTGTPITGISEWSMHI